MRQRGLLLGVLPIISNSGTTFLDMEVGRAYNKIAIGGMSMRC